MLRERLREPDDAVARLLIGGEPVDGSDLAPGLVTALAQAGVVAPSDAEVTPLIRVQEWDELLIAHDPDRPHEIGRDTVLGVNSTTRALAALTPRAQVGRALDLATGPGGLALRLAGHAREVVGTDISDRALWLAELNAQLNQTEIDLRRGDLFEPVAGDTAFDLITANLPFVISPDSAFTFRDGGRPADDLSRDAVQGAAQHLAPTGTAVLMCNWLVPRGAEADRAPLGWAAGVAGSTVVLHHSTESPRDYAERWNQFVLAQDPGRYAAAVERWVTAFDEWDVDGIASGAVAIRLAARERRFAASIPMRTAPSGDGGAQLDRIFENRGWLESLGAAADDALRAATPVLPGTARLEQAMEYDGGWSAAAAVLVLADTCGAVGDVEPLAVHTVLRLDGTTPVARLIDEVAAATGLPTDELDVPTLRSIRALLAAGCLAL